MKNTNLTQLSIEELRKQERLLKTATRLLIGMSIVLAGAIIFLIIKQGFTVIPISLTVVVSSLLTLCFTNKKNLEGIQTEIASRDISV